MSPHSAAPLSLPALAALCEAVPCAVFLLDGKTRVTFANRAAVAMLGALPSQLSGKPFLDLVAEGHRDLVAGALGREGFALDAALLRSDGDPVPACLRGLPQSEGWSVTAEDRTVEVSLREELATARDAAEFQLARTIEMSQRNRELLAQLSGDLTLSTRTFRAEETIEDALRAAGVAMWHWDVSVGDTTLRGDYETIFGFQPRNFAEVREAIAVSERDALLKEAERARREKTAMDVRLHIRARDGTTRLVRVAGRPRYDSRGEVVAIDGCLVDETYRERARSNLEHLDHELRILVEGMSDGVAIIDREWRLLYVNRKGAELVGKTPADIVGHRLTDLFPGSAAPDFRRAHRKAMLERIPVEVEGLYAPLDRTFVHRVYPTDEGIAVFFQDVTEWRGREERLRVSEQSLRELGVRMRDAREEEAQRIAREIHDDLGQALTVLKMDVARLRARLSKAAPDGHVGDDVTGSLAEMDAVVDGAVATTRRIASDLRPAILDDLGLAPAIAWLSEQVSARAGFAIDVDVPAGDVSVDAAGAIVLYRVLQEALTNIARHANATHVTVKLRERAPNVVLEVTDDGRGFDPGSPTRSFGLLGMRERTGSVGGSLEVQSTPGKGTRVRALVPRKLAFDPSPTLPEAKAPGEGRPT